MITLKCPVTTIVWGHLNSDELINQVIYSPHPLLMLPLKFSRHLINDEKFFDLPNRDANLIAISFLISCSASLPKIKPQYDSNTNEFNHSTKSDFLILKGNLSLKFIDSSSWGKLSRARILTAGEMLSNIKSYDPKVRKHLPESIILNDSNIQNVPSIIVDGLTDYDTKAKTSLRINEERVLTQLLINKKQKNKTSTTGDSVGSLELIPSRGITFLISLLDELPIKLTDAIKGIFSSLLSSKGIPEGISSGDVKRLITLLDTTDSTASIKFLALNILDKKLMKLNSQSLLHSLGFEDESLDTPSISNVELESFYESLSNSRKPKPSFSIKESKESKESKDSNTLESLTSLESPLESKESGNWESVADKLKRLKALLKK